MKKPKTNARERGVALLLALFALMLLAALGLAMLAAADLETRIAANYRDKQGSIYAALSGLQEARDRLIPSRCGNTTGGCDDPVALDWRNLGLPTSGSPNVLYIINPASGETVAPWNPNNPYFDSQLCTSAYFTTTPVVSITGGGAGASATASMTANTCIVGWSVSLASTCAAQGGNTLTVGASGGDGSGTVPNAISESQPSPNPLKVLSVRTLY